MPNKISIFVALFALLCALAHGQSTSPISPGSSAEQALGSSGGSLPSRYKLLAAKRGSTVVPLQVDSADRLLINGSISAAGLATEAKQDTGNASLASIDGKLPATLGQKAMAASLACVLPSDQSAIPVSQSGAWTVAATQSGTWNVNNISGTVSLPTGAATAANQTTELASLSSIDTKLSSQATATKQDTGNTSLASIDGKVPANLTVSATRLLVDGSGVTQPVSGTVTTVVPSAASSTVSSASNSASNFTVLASNASRKGAYIVNDSATNCYYKFGATATTSSYTFKLFSYETFTMDPPIYTGIIDAICDAGSGNTRATEL